MLAAEVKAPPDLPPELAVELDALVEELLQLPGHGAVVGRGPEDDAVVAEEVGRGRVLNRLQVDLETLRLEDLGDPGRHSLGISRPGIIRHHGFGHRVPPVTLPNVPEFIIPECHSTILMIA